MKDFIIGVLGLACMVTIIMFNVALYAGWIEIKYMHVDSLADLFVACLVELAVFGAIVTDGD